MAMPNQIQRARWAALRENKERMDATRVKKIDPAEIGHFYQSEWELA